MANGDVKVQVIVSGTTADGDAIRGLNETKTHTSIADVFERLLTVPTSSVTVLAIGTVAGATLGALNVFIIQNMDASNFVTIGFLEGSAQAAHFKLAAGDLLLLMTDQMDVNDSAVTLSALASVDSITLLADTGAVKCRVMAF